MFPNRCWSGIIVFYLCQWQSRCIMLAASLSLLLWVAKMLLCQGCVAVQFISRVWKSHAGLIWWYAYLIGWYALCISYKVIYISYKAKCVSVEYTIRCHPSPLMIFHFPVLYKNSSWSQNRIFLKRPESNPCLRRAYHWATTPEKYRSPYIFSLHICSNTKISVQ